MPRVRVGMTRRHLKVATYNVHGCVGTDRKFALARTADAIASLEADVVILQEVGDALRRWPAVNQAHDLAERCRMSYAVGYTMPVGPWGYGNAVLTKGEITEVERFDISVDGKEPRGCLRLDVRLDGVTLKVIGLHLGLGWRERRKQVRQLLAHGGALHGVERGVVIGGDFNDFGLGPTRLLPRKNFVDAAQAKGDMRPTFPSRLPVLRLDRLYSRGDVTVTGYNVVRSPLTRIASDHLPVVAEYEVT